MSDDGAPKAIQSVILFIQRVALRPVVREELRNCGVTEFLGAESEEQCLQFLAEHPQALLAIDWEHGYATVAKVLQNASGASFLQPRPIYLLAAETDHDVVAIGTEHRVSRIHVGDVSRSVIQEHVKTLLKQKSTDITLQLEGAFQARAENRWSDASHILKSLYEQNPIDDVVVLEYCVNLIHEENWDQALQVIEALAVLDKKNLRAQNLYARCLMKRQDFNKAIRILEDAKIISPLQVDRLVDLGNCLFKVNRVKEAYENFRMAFEFEPLSRGAVQGMGACKLVEGEVNECLDLLRPISTPEELASVFNNAAILCMRQKRFESGFHLYETAIGAVSGDKKKVLARLMFNMALGFFRWKKFDKAREFFDKASALDSAFKKAVHNAKIMERVVAKSAPADSPHLSVAVDNTSAGAPPEAPALPHQDYIADEFEDEAMGF